MRCRKGGGSFWLLPDLVSSACMRFPQRDFLGRFRVADDSRAIGKPCGVRPELLAACRHRLLCPRVLISRKDAAYLVGKLSARQTRLSMTEIRIGDEEP